jgi:allantoin racemase
MKIWCQSCGALGRDAIWNDYEQALQSYAREVTRADTVVDFYGVRASIPGIDRYHASQAVCDMQSIRNAIRAEREGYDVFVVINTRDAGFNEIKELVSIPTVFMLETCIHFAMMLGPRFAFFTHNLDLFLRLTELTHQYGLARQMVPGGHLNLTYSDWPDLFGSPEKYIEPFRQKIEEIVARGANILIPSALTLNLWLLKQNMMEVKGGRVLDGIGLALKTAELMVDLKNMGIVRTTPGPPSQGMLAAIQKLYE